MDNSDIIEELHFLLDSEGDDVKERFYKHVKNYHTLPWTVTCSEVLTQCFTWSGARQDDNKEGLSEIYWPSLCEKWRRRSKELKVANRHLRIEDPNKPEYDLDEILRYKPVDTSDMPEEVIPSNYKAR